MRRWGVLSLVGIWVQRGKVLAHALQQCQQLFALSGVQTRHSGGVHPLALLLQGALHGLARFSQGQGLIKWNT